MSHYEDLYPSRFLKGVTMTEPLLIYITAFVPEGLENDHGQVEQKAILKYKDAVGEGEIVWCKSNAKLTAAALGTDDHTEWAGRFITIHFDPSVRFGRETPGGIRVCGSPELKKAITVSIKMPRKSNPDVYKLRPTPGPDGGAKSDPDAAERAQIEAAERAEAGQ